VRKFVFEVGIPRFRDALWNLDLGSDATFQRHISTPQSVQFGRAMLTSKFENGKYPPLSFCLLLIEKIGNRSKNHKKSMSTSYS
jgi:hypothetical protein